MEARRAFGKVLGQTHPKAELSTILSLWLGTKAAGLSP